MMNLEIKATMDENERQKEMRKNQIANATVKPTKPSGTVFKDKVTKIQDRLRIVSFAIQAIPTGIAMSRRLRKSPKTSKPLLMKSVLHPIPSSRFCLHKFSLWTITNGDEADCRDCGFLRGNEPDGEIERKILLTMPWEKSRR
jgi:hypothetical protein